MSNFTQETLKGGVTVTRRIDSDGEFFELSNGHQEIYLTKENIARLCGIAYPVKTAKEFWENNPGLCNPGFNNQA